MCLETTSKTSSTALNASTFVESVDIHDEDDAAVDAVAVVLEHAKTGFQSSVEYDDPYKID